MSRLYGVALTQPSAPPRPRSRAPSARQQLLRFTASVPRLRVSLRLATRADHGAEWLSTIALAARNVRMRQSTRASSGERLG